MTRKTVCLIALLALVCAAAAATRAGGQEPAREKPTGEILIERGLIKIRREDSERVFRQKNLAVPVFETDVIHSGADTRAVLRMFETGETVTIYADTHVKVSELHVERGLFVLNAGKALFSLLRNLSKNRDVRVQTRTATVGVKGTRFIVGAREEESFALTLEGEVAATPTAQPEREVRIRPGEMYFVTGDIVPEAAIAVEPEARERILSEDGLGGLRRAAGLPEGGAGGTGPLTIVIRLGLGGHEVVVPFQDGGGQRAVVSGGAGLLSVEWRFWGPFMVEFAGIRGNVDEVSVEGQRTGGVTGDMSTVAFLAGLRGDLGSWFTASIAGGPFRHSSQIRGGGDTTVNVEGLMARATLDYVLDNGIMLGMVLYVGRGNAEGSGPDELRAQGFTVEQAEVSYIAVSVGGRF